MTDQQPDLDAIEAKTAELRERLDRKNPWPCDNEAYWQTTGWRTGTRNALDKLHVEELVAEVRRLRAELADFSGRVNELESKLCDCEPVREHDDYKRPAFYQHEAHCPVTELDHAVTKPATERRTLTEAEHSRAWHAIEGAAGEEGADPGTVLNAVLAALGINPPAACPGFEKEYQGVSDAKRRLANCKHCGKPRAAHAAAPAARSAAV